MSATLPPGSCNHRPISNGWSSGWSSETGTHPSASWCGYCKAVIEHDAEWVAKFADAGKAAPTPSTSRASTPLNPQSAGAA